MRGTLLLPLITTLACHGGPRPTPATAVATPSGDAGPMDLSSIELAAPPGMAFYYLVLLRRGPRWTAEATDETRALSEGHMANIERLAREGRLVLAGPVLDAGRPGDLAGIFVFDVRSLAEVRALLASDPAIEAGRFDVEIRAWMAGAGIRTAHELPPPDELAERFRCRDSARHAELDFWVGTWVVRDAEGTLAGHNRIEKAQYGCVLHEHWTGARGATGHSVNYVDPATGDWVQLWTDASGGVIRLRGGLDAGSMSLSGDHVKADGTTSALRGTWTPLDDGRVRQHFEESTDGGETWKTWFEGYYSRR
jgi:uncharacterized protein YciI